MADRYTYIPSLGLLLLAIWGIYELARRWRYQVIALSVAGSVMLFICAALTRQQLAYWKDSEALFRHALEVTQNNYLAYNNLGLASLDCGRVDDALSQFRKALEIYPRFAKAHNNLGNALLQKGLPDEAAAQYQEAVDISPGYALARNNLGAVFLQRGRLDEALVQFQKVVAADPGNGLAMANLGLTLLQKGEVAQAVACCRKAVQIDPDNPEFLNNLARILASCSQPQSRDGAEAVRLAGRACQLTQYKQPMIVGTLAAAYAEAGRFDDAVAMAEKACDLALALGQRAVAHENAELLLLYRARRPFHEGETNAP